MSTQQTFGVSRPPRVFDKIISQVEEWITSGELTPGDRLPSERALAEQFSVNRHTVREALRMLEISGVVTLKRGRQGGAFITPSGPAAIATSISNGLSLTDFSLEDLTDCMRWILELVVRVAGPRMTEEDFRRLEENIDAAAALDSPEDRVERAMLLLKFYNIFAESADNPVLAVLMESLLSILRDVIPRLETLDHTFVLRARRRIVKLLRKGDVEAANIEMDKYLVRLHTRWLKSDDGRAIQSMPPALRTPTNAE